MEYIDTSTLPNQHLYITTMSNNTQTATETSIANCSDIKYAIQYLTKLFEFALYIRGWDGPETPYIPLNQKPSYEKFQNAGLHLVEFHIFAETLPPHVPEKIRAFQAMTWKAGFYGPSGQTIGHILDEIAVGNYACYLAANHLISTAIYYLKEQHNYVLPGVGITTMEHFC